MQLAESLKNAGRGIEAAEAYLAAAHRISADEGQSHAFALLMSGRWAGHYRRFGLAAMPGWVRQAEDMVPDRHWSVSDSEVPTVANRELGT